ncbi:MAG: PGF-CTERM sorting domain-containing protein [Methanocorpusculum sp.]|nr:PGF-CTERM sorting domain-containing protein [Methanocorpusculum sp.]
MNAKKIMGAVLVALLALTAFAGVAAATDYGTVFTYQNTSEVNVLTDKVLPDGVWNNGAAQITVADGVVYPGANFAAGTYKFGDHKVYVTYPTAAYAVGATIGDDTQYLVANGGNVYATSVLDFTVKGAATGFDVTYVYLTYPNGTAVKTLLENIEGAVLTPADEKGVYKIQAIFETTGFVEGVPSNLLLDTVSALTFTVVGAEDATIAASVDTVYTGEKVTLTVKGTPGTKYLFNSSNLTIENNQLVEIDSVTGEGYEFTMPNVGEASFIATVTGEKKTTIALKYWNDTAYVAVKGKPEIKITISAPVVTATLGAPAYFIGDVIEITGTATAAAPFTFNITGTNVKEFEIEEVEFEEGKEWTANLTIEQKLDVGTYTIKVLQSGKVVATLPVALKQPFISIADAPEVIAQGDAASFLITAEAATVVKAYFFGTNYFYTTDSQPEHDENDEPIASLFNVTLEEDDTKKEVMATGQYFVVFQHPMYDKVFNIGAEETGAVKLNNYGVWTSGSEIFNATSRQTANAAQALCDALDSQNIDDMYVKYSFFVVEDLEKDTFSMSEIPTEVVKGNKIVISGVDTASKEGTLVTVEMVSTAFAAVPKETVGSAAFILVTTTIAEDGTWEVTLDTSDLNVDEYSLSVAIDSVPKESVTVDVIEAADEPVDPEQPGDEPEQPTDEPEAPATPGFGALAALAGLGAVAVLLLRRE